MDTTRQEHLQWCKDRAMEYIKAGDATQAMASMMSDIRKHPETENHPAIQLAAMMMFSGMLSDLRETERFIQGFN